MRVVTPLRPTFASPFEGGWIIVSNCAPKPTPTLNLPDLTSEMWEAVVCSYFFTSTPTEELDDLNLRSGSDMYDS